MLLCCPPHNNKAARTRTLGSRTHARMFLLLSFCCSFVPDVCSRFVFSICSLERVPVEGEQLAAERNVNAALHQEIAMAMLQSRHLSLPMLVQCAFVHNALKVVLAGLKVSQRMDDKTLVSGGWGVVTGGDWW